MLPNRPFITLSEAITWIAFGDPLDGSSLQRTMRHQSSQERLESEAKVAKAVAQLTELAAGGLIEVRGKRMDHVGVNEGQADTQTIEAVKLADFTMFDAYLDGLYRGRGLRWVGKTDGSESIAKAVSDECLVSVSVRRADVLRQFPSKNAKSRNAARSSKEAETACAIWLSETLAKETGKPKPKSDLRDEALGKWEQLSARGFNRAWDEVAPSFGRNLPGRKSEH